MLIVWLGIDLTAINFFYILGDEKSIKKTTTKAKKKPEKKPSIFDDDVPSIFDDPLNATSK